jgi:hypothetical protein
MQCPRHRPEVFLAMKKVQPLFGILETVLLQIPNPHRPVGKRRIGFGPMAATVESKQE